MPNVDLALTNCFVYGTSLAVMEQIEFIRMYPLLQLFSVIYLYLHIKLLRHQENMRFYISLYIIMILGILTQYYFVVFAFFPAVFCSIYMSRILQMYSFINVGIFGGALKKVLLLSVLGIMMIAVKRMKNREAIIKRPDSFHLLCWLMISGTAAFYFLIIAHVTPYLVSRYLSPIYALILLCASGFTYYMLKKIIRYEWCVYLLIAGLFCIPLADKLDEDMTDVNKLEMLRIAEENGAYGCIIPGEEFAGENFMELVKYQRFYAAEDETYAELEDEEIKNADKLVVYVKEGLDPAECLDNLFYYNHNLTSYERLYVA